MELKLIGENLGQDLSTLSQYEAYFNEGDTGELRVYLDRQLSQDEINQLEYELCSQEVVLTEPIAQDARILVIKFQKAIAPLLIIGGAIVAIVGVVLGWQIFKLTQWGIPLWTILIGGAALFYLLFREPVKKAAPYAIHAGKVYLTKKAAK